MRPTIDQKVIEVLWDKVGTRLISSGVTESDLQIVGGKRVDASKHAFYCVVSIASNACLRLGPDPRRALGPAATRAASTGRTHDRTRPMLHQRKKALVNPAPSTHDPEPT
jgi:hypothetical protein